MTAIHQYGTFYVDRFHFAITVDRVQEVLNTLPTTPVPLTNRIVNGLINLRGQIVMAIDLRLRLELPRRAAEKHGVSLIVRTNDGLVCIEVDRLGDVLDFDMIDTGLEQLDELPETVTGPIRHLVRGIIKLDETLLLVLDPDLLADSEICLGSIKAQAEIN